MRRRLLLALLTVVIVAILWQVGNILWIGGYFRGIDPHFAGMCRLLSGPIGPEDLTIHPATGVAYISAADRRAAAAGAARPGGIWRYDLNDPQAVPVNLTPDADESFQPHGISLWADGIGPDVLFVINHPPPAPGSPGGAHHTVEVFDLIDGGLVHRASLTHPLLVMPNDLVAVGRDRFYLTNTHRHAPGVMQDLETYLQLAGAQVLFYGPGGFRPALEDMVLPNGINVSADGRTLYVAAVTERSVLVYDRDPATETLRLRERVFVDTGPDNIEVAADGTLWIGAHPKLLALQAHGADPSAPAPAQVVRVRATDGGYAVDEVYLNDGSQLAAASVAAVRGARLLIGQIFGDGILDCEMAAAPAEPASDE